MNQSALDTIIFYILFSNFTCGGKTLDTKTINPSLPWKFWHWVGIEGKIVRSSLDFLVIGTRTLTFIKYFVLGYLYTRVYSTPLSLILEVLGFRQINARTLGNGNERSKIKKFLLDSFFSSSGSSLNSCKLLQKFLNLIDPDDCIWLVIPPATN